MALVGRDRCWLAVKAKNIIQKLLARPRCLCPCGATAIQLAVKTKKLGSLPAISMLLWRNRCWPADKQKLVARP
jgi:hypothetical protein